MAVLANLVHQHQKHWVTVGLYGKHNQMYHDQSVLDDSLETAIALGACSKNICVMVPASNHKSEHFQMLVPASPTTNLQDRTWADAVWTKDPRAAVVLPTADCQSIILKNLVTGIMIVAHGGKPAMTPGHIKSHRWYNIVDRCIEKAVENADPSNLQIFITGAISGKNYWHDDQPGQAAMAPFKRLYSDEVFYGGDPKEGRLDLVSVTRIIARRRRVPIDQIVSDGLCTYEHQQLASYRRGAGGERNIVIAVNRSVRLSM